MQPIDVLTEYFARVDDHVVEILDGLSPDDLTWRPAEGANPIGWLVWHLARVIDAQIADVADVAQVWVVGDWAKGFGLDADPTNSGYGHTADQVAAVRPRDTGALGGYYTRVSEQARDYLATLTSDDLDRVIDEHWDPPVTLGVRLVSIADDAVQHAGQAKYAKGMLPD
ncbi:MAG TPA: DUF664 domain-containing protein [Acidimicrobiales bacterium]|nr:DUF664 domain-containing protein [Acidimicrobiales bacterium]